jgi:hypothetical protein
MPKQGAEVIECPLCAAVGGQADIKRASPDFLIYEYTT